MSENKEWVHRVCFNAYFEDALAKYRAKTGFGNTYAILNSLNEFWYREGCMSEEGYEFNKKKYGATLIDNLKQSEKTYSEITEAKTLAHRIPERKLIDYSKLSDDELLKRYQNAILSNDVVETQMIQGEARKRGYRFRADDSGKVQIIRVI